MNLMFSAIATTLLLTMFAPLSMADSTRDKPVSGEAEFEKHCSICHGNGGNTINPAKTLRKKSLESHGIRTTKDIVMKMRNPGPGMTRFDNKIIDDREAKAIAEYVLKTFK